MRKNNFLEMLHLLGALTLAANSCYCFEAVSSTALIGGIALSGGFAAYSYVKCQFYECCDDRWIRTSLHALEHALETQLHGQHLVNFIVSRSIRGHLKNKNPKKALVMSFHGWTGSGKNHVSKIIVENLYKKGGKSQFVHWYISTTHFPHVEKVQKYKDQLRRDIIQHTRLCGRSVFVFDEIDKMPPGVIDALKPFIDYHEEIDGIDYRHNIFIFLSNTGGTEISKLAYDFWVKGEDREDIAMSHIEPLINKGAFNEKGGLRLSDIIEKNLIDNYVPFLPLEKRHVKLCIIDELRARSLYDSDQHDISGIIDTVLNQLQYYPDEFEVFSKSGCKKIDKKVDLYIE